MAFFRLLRAVSIAAERFWVVGFPSKRSPLIKMAGTSVTPASTASGYVLMRYEINVEEGILLLHPIEPMCIEGCSYKFKRRNDR